MKDEKLHKRVLSALFAALTCVATMVIHIPSPLNGYVNAGDCFVLLSGWLLGPFYGFFAAGLGSGLADLFLGYTSYIPGTFLIKGLMALVACLLARGLTAASRGHVRPARLLSSVAAETVMVLGYFAYAALLLGKGLGAAASVPGNIAQGVGGIVISMLLVEIFQRIGLLDKMTEAGISNGK